MATHKSSEKRARQAVRRSDRNSAAQNKVRTWEKKLRKAISLKDSKTAQEFLKGFESTIGKAAQKGVVEVKAASRKISRLTRQVHQLAAK